LASLSLAATLGGGLAITGCGDNTTTTPPAEAGTEGGADAPIDRGAMADVTPDMSVDRAPDVVPDVTVDNNPPPPDAGPDVVDAGPQCGTPTFMPAAGAITVGSNVTIVPPTGFPANGVIYYTVDGTTPFHMPGGSSSPIYSGPIQVSQDETIHAVAYAAGGCTDSLIAAAAYTVVQPEAGSLTTPIFNPQSVTRDNDFLLGLSSTAGATICYTLDGVTTPTCNVTATAATCSGNSQTYNAASQISINGSLTNMTDMTKIGQVTVQAIACEPGAMTTTVSATMGTQTYTLQAAQPTMVNPAPATLAYTSGGATPTITSGTNGSSIQYTTNGMTPSCAAGSPGSNIAPANGTTPPSGIITISTSTTVNAIACKSGYLPSAMPDAMTYTVQLNPPGFQVGTGTYDNTVSPTLSPVLNGTTAIANPANSYVCYSTSGPAGCGAPGTGGAAGACATGSTNEAATASSITATGTTLDAVTCTPNAASYSSSNGMTSQTYTLTLDPPYLNPPDNSTPPIATAQASYAIPASMTMVTPTIGQTQPNTAAGQAPGFWCVAIGTTTAMPATPTCGTNACSGTGATLIAYSGTPPSIGTALSANSVVTAVSCAGPGVSFNSGMTTVTYGGPGSAGTPTISAIDAVTNAAASPGLNYDPLTVILTNNATDTATPTLCYSTNGTAPTCTSAATPTCSGTGNTGTTTNSAGGALTAAGASTVTGFRIVTGGSGYSASAPPVVTVSASNGGGTRATATATVNGSGVVTGLVLGNAGTKYTSATVTITGGGGTGATAIAFTSNQTFVTVPAAVQVDPTTVIVVGCTANQQQLGNSTATYNFQVMEPTFANAGGTNISGGGAVSGGDVITIATTSQFSDTTIHYTTTPGMTANCASGTVITGASGTVTVPETATSFSLSAIGCGTNQQASASARSATFTVGTAPPAITTNQITSGTNANKPQSPWDNTFSATLTSTTTSATICYNLGGAAGCNGGGCDVNSTPLTNGGTFTVVASGSVNAVACSATLGASAAMPTQSFVLQFPAVNITTTGTCPAATDTFTIGFDNSTPTNNPGGPTQNATLCWSIDNSTITNCTASAGHVTCASTGGGGVTRQTIGTFSMNTAVNYEVCSPTGTTFTGSGAQMSGTASLALPYAPAGSVTIDGINQGTSEWPAARTYAGTAATGTTGYFTYDATNLYIGVTYSTTTPNYTAANDYLVFYLGDGTTAGSTSGPPQLGARPAPFSAAWAFAWNTNTAGATVVAYSYSGGTWSTSGFGSSVTVGFRAGGYVEFQLPVSAIPFANQTVNLGGGVLTGVSTTTPAQPSVWPATSYVSTVLNSCQGPTVP
jgi:hypothetical protein